MLRFYERIEANALIAFIACMLIKGFISNCNAWLDIFAVDANRICAESQGIVWKILWPKLCMWARNVRF